MGSLLTFPTDRTRPSTENLKRVRLRVVAADGVTIERPKTRGECVGGERPCPWVGCRHHLFLDVTNGGTSITYPFPDSEPDELAHSCSLDVADDGGITLDDVGTILNVTRERIRQIGDKVLDKVRRHRSDVLAEFVDEDPDKLELRGAMGHGGRLGDGARVEARLTEQADEQPEPVEKHVASHIVWPPDPRDLREEHDALAGQRIWSAYIRDSHSRGIAANEFSPHRRDTNMGRSGDERRDAIVQAIREGNTSRAEIAKAIGVEPGAAGMSLKLQLQKGVIARTGIGSGTRYSLPDGATKSIAEVVAKPRTKPGPKPKAKEPAVGKRPSLFDGVDTIGFLHAKRDDLQRKLAALDAAIEALS